jgi:rRNA-processing protein FCF1
MKKIILDTNFLLIPSQSKVDIFAEIDKICMFKYELCIVDKTIDELNNIIEKQKGKHKAAAKLALQLIKSKHLKTLATHQDTDVDTILASFSEKGYIVATQDKELKKRVKARIILKQRKYLILEGI